MEFQVLGVAMKQGLFSLIIKLSRIRGQQFVQFLYHPPLFAMVTSRVT